MKEQGNEVKDRRWKSNTFHSSLIVKQLSLCLCVTYNSESLVNRKQKRIKCVFLQQFGYSRSTNASQCTKCRHTIRSSVVNGMRRP